MGVIEDCEEKKVSGWEAELDMMMLAERTHVVITSQTITITTSLGILLISCLSVSLSIMETTKFY